MLLSMFVFSPFLMPRELRISNLLEVKYVNDFVTWTKCIFVIVLSYDLISSEVYRFFRSIILNTTKFQSVSWICEGTLE